MLRKILKWGMFSSGLILAIDYNSKELKIQLITRNLRTIRCGINILYSYKIKFNPINAEAIHERIAKDIYETCLINDGLYVKFGQGMASMDHVLPPAFFKWLQLLQDKAKQVPFREIQEVIEQDLKMPCQQIFRSIDEIPIASASIAQVHRAILHSGEIVAVKVQKPNIQRQFKTDMFMHWVICSVLQFSFDLPILQFQQTIEDNLAKEINFEQELQNSEKARLLNKRNDLYIPKNFKEISSKRVLITEWIDGIKITHLNEVKKQGFDQKSVMKTVIECFAEQIFISGFVHCDPHPGNIFVRGNPKNPKQHQVVLLDFGLCLELDEEFRHDYANFWKALFLQNRKKLTEITSKWGVGNQEAFATMQLMRPYRHAKPIHLHQLSKEEVFEMQIKMKNDVRQVLKQANLFPSDLLFVNRNMNLVRSVNKKCGSLINRINLMAKVASKGSNQHSKFEQFFFSIRLLLSSLIYNTITFFMKWKSGGKKGFEDYIDNVQKQAFESMYKQYGFKVPDEKTFDA